ncbi:AAA family ATPase [Halobacillus faecis]|uniref:Uncharacterized AAA domain-containing protein ycf46 n=1 Tax=Halobacillus faecis TaxID=360184 RepID=A0A511WTU8_9BACI|nr:AAA family ATPase [Halobacillus faecis]GEN54594.1 ATPase [Halobacillus faecis]
MQYFHTQNELKKLILAGYPLIYIVTDDQRPVMQTIHEVVKSCTSAGFSLYTWNEVSGLYDEQKKEVKHLNSEESLRYLNALDSDSIVVLHDFHNFIKNDKRSVQNLKECLMKIKQPISPMFKVARYEKDYKPHNKTIIITAPNATVPPELNKLMHIIHFERPGLLEIETILKEFAKEEDFYDEENHTQILQASLGLTETEIINAYSYSIISNKKIDPPVVKRQKKQIIEKSGLLEYEEPSMSLEDVGGLNNLLNWIKKRKIAYDEQRREKYKLDYPKGLLMTGIQGCGKSFTAKAIASYFQVPFLKMDMGSLMNKWVGESESNIRNALSVAESIAPSVLFIDEIEKGIADPSSGNSHEVSNRILSTLLTWLQEKTAPVFVVATSNNIDKLPPELLRKGRFDEIFFIDLPDEKSRADIFTLKLKKKRQNPDHFDTASLAKLSLGFSGAEIESAVNEALFEAAYQDIELSTNLIKDELNRTSPLSISMKDKIEEIKLWAEENYIRKAY